MLSQSESALFQRIRRILESARAVTARSVNTAQVTANWLIGREIVEEEQRGNKKAEYGQKLIAELSKRLQRAYGTGYSATNLKLFRQFFLAYPILIDALIGHTSRGELKLPANNDIRTVISMDGGIGHTACDQSWGPGRLHPNLSWSLYRHLVRVERTNARAFYEVEAIKNNWSARELERQINSLLYERLAKSKNKAELMRLARKGQEIKSPEDVFKEPTVIEFLGLPENPALVETKIETALINNLQAFLLELGRGENTK